MVDHSAQSQYAAAAHVPLIKSPAVRVPPQAELPPDIHPLPDSVTPYFAYPFVLEPHVIALEASRRNTLATHAARRDGLLRSRKDEKERRRREALKRVAPGFDGHGTPLEPVRAPQALVGQANESGSMLADSSQGTAEGVDIMDDLVDQLERMISATAGAAGMTMQ